MLPIEEHEVANVMVNLILRNCGPRAPTLDEFAHFYGTASYQCGFVQKEDDFEPFKRIRAEVSWRIAELSREAGELAVATSALAAANKRRRRWR